jgi:phosphatidylglycerophosphate synthase
MAAASTRDLLIANDLERLVEHTRLNGSFLAEQERLLLAWLVRRLPSSVTPNHLTIAGLIGGMLTAGGFGACHLSNYFIILAIFGLFLNWFGDSLDGTLARYRRIERPHFGYFVDHSSDLIAQTFIIIGLGLSPYFTLASALFMLSMYLLISSYTYLKVMILRTHHLSYGGMGATELRLLIACWALFAAWAGPGLIAAHFFNYPVIDAVIGVLWMLTFIAFMWIVRNDLSQLSDSSQEAASQHQPQIAPVGSTFQDNAARAEKLETAPTSVIVAKL